MLIQSVASINLDTKDRMKPIDWDRLEGQDHNCPHLRRDREFNMSRIETTGA